MIHADYSKLADEVEQDCGTPLSALNNAREFLDSVEWTDNASETNAANVMAEIDIALKALFERELSAAKVELADEVTETRRLNALIEASPEYEQQISVLRAELAKLKSTPLYGYGIVDKDGCLWIDFSIDPGDAPFLASTEEVAQSVVEYLNQSPLADTCAPYRVVELFFKESEEKKDG